MARRDKGNSKVVKSFFPFVANSVENVSYALKIIKNTLHALYSKMMTHFYDNAFDCIVFQMRSQPAVPFLRLLKVGIV